MDEKSVLHWRAVGGGQKLRAALRSYSGEQIAEIAQADAELVEKAISAAQEASVW